VEISSFYFDILKDRLYTFGKNSRERLSAQTVLEHIFVKLTALLAPVLSFTAEEAYNAYKKDKSSEKNLQDSVFMLDMPKIDTSFVNEDIEKKFDAIIDIREFVLKLLEEERKKGVIGNSLEAKLTIYAKSEEKRKFLKDNLANLIGVCMVSQIVLADSPCCGIADGTGDTEFLVSHATGKKCARCWMWAEDVGRIPEHPEICSKCVKNLSL